MEVGVAGWNVLMAVVAAVALVYMRPWTVVNRVPDHVVRANAPGMKRTTAAWNANPLTLDPKACMLAQSFVKQ